MSKTIIAVRHFGLGGRESLETAVIENVRDFKNLVIKPSSCNRNFLLKCDKLPKILPLPDLKLDNFLTGNWKL